MHIRAADGRPGDLDEHVVRSHFRLRHLIQPDTGSGFFLHQCFQEMTPSSRPTAVNASSAFSSCSRDSAADICVRIRAWPRGTTGNEKPITYTPRCSRLSAI